MAGFASGLAETHPPPLGLRGMVRIVLGMAVAYFVAAEFGHLLTVGSQPVFASFWPASGLYLAVLLTTPLSRWPLVILGAALGNALADGLLQDRGVSTVVGFVVANAAEAALGALLLSRVHPIGRWRIEGVRDGLALALLGAGLGPVAGAVIGALVVWSVHGVPIAQTLPVWWAGDALGVVLVTPAVLALRTLPDGRATAPLAQLRSAIAAHGGEVLAITLAILATAWFVLIHPDVPVVYLMLPSLLWAAMRFGPGGGSLASLAASTLVVGMTRLELGPFAVLGMAQQALVLQTLLAAYSGTTLLVALLFLERIRAETSLESRVKDRTRELSTSEERYRSIVEMSQEAIFVILQGRIAYCNEAFVRLMGARGRAEMIGLDPMQLVAEEDRASVAARIEKMIRTGARQSSILERRLRRFDGQEVVVETSVALYEASGLRGVQVLARDVTERKRIERALWKNRERMKLALRAARMYVFEFDVEAQTAIRSSEAAEVVGLPTHQPTPIGQFEALVNPEDTEIHRTRHDGLRGPGDVYQCTYRFQHPARGPLVLEEFGRGVFDHSGRLVTVVGIVADVTEREATLARLKASEERFARLAEVMPALLLTADAQGNCDYVNPAFCSLTGLSRSQAAGAGWLETIDPRDQRRVIMAWETARNESQTFSTEARVLAQDGSARWFKAISVPVYDRDHQVTQWIAVALDVDDQKRTEAELQEADRRKDEYLAMLAHELRNPLAPIRNAGALLLRRIDSADMLRPAAEMIERQSRHLSRLVDELLDVSRVTRGKIRLDIQPVDLMTALRNGIEAALPALDRRRQRLELDLPGEGYPVTLDVVRFAQVIANLLDNASKFSPEGSPIDLVAQADEHEVVIRVSDRGEGIAAELLPGVFELFTQAQGPIDRAAGGLGIGLALVKALVELHGGHVRAESAGPGTGACFTVTLPRFARVPAEALENQDQLTEIDSVNG